LLLILLESKREKIKGNLNKNYVFSLCRKINTQKKRDYGGGEGDADGRWGD
jgi:hypothetical protein